MDSHFENHLANALACMQDKGTMTVEEIFVNAVEEGLRQKFTGNDIGFAELICALKPGSGVLNVFTSDIGIGISMSEHMLLPSIVEALAKEGYTYTYDDVRRRGMIGIQLPQEQIPYIKDGQILSTSATIMMKDESSGSHHAEGDNDVPPRSGEPIRSTLTVEGIRTNND